MIAFIGPKTPTLILMLRNLDIVGDFSINVKAKYGVGWEHALEEFWEYIHDMQVRQRTSDRETP